MYEKMGMQLAVAAMAATMGNPLYDDPFIEMKRSEFDELTVFANLLARSDRNRGLPTTKKKKTKNRKNKSQRLARKKNR